MRSNVFEITSTWLVAASIEEVAAILSVPERLPDWWPAVYLGVKVLDPGRADGIGRSVAFHTRGWLPYTLRWRGEVVASSLPRGMTVEASGDLAGRGVWRLEQRGDLAAVTYDWRVRVEKRWLKPLSPILRPLYAANHRWAMARGLEGLNRELVRNRAALLPEEPVIEIEARQNLGRRQAV